MCSEYRVVRKEFAYEEMVIRDIALAAISELGRMRCMGMFVVKVGPYSVKAFKIEFDDDSCVERLRLLKKLKEEGGINIQRVFNVINLED